VQKEFSHVVFGVSYYCLLIKMISFYQFICRFPMFVAAAKLLLFFELCKKKMKKSYICRVFLEILFVLCATTCLYLELFVLPPNKPERAKGEPYVMNLA